MNRLLALALPVLAALVLYAPTLRYERTFDDVHQVTAPGVAETRGLAMCGRSPTGEPRSAAGSSARS